MRPYVSEAEAEAPPLSLHINQLCTIVFNNGSSIIEIAQLNNSLQHIDYKRNRINKDRMISIVSLVHFSCRLKHISGFFAIFTIDCFKYKRVLSFTLNSFTVTISAVTFNFLYFVSLLDSKCAVCVQKPDHSNRKWIIQLD